MTGLIYKDFLALKGHLTTYLVFFLVYGCLCLSGVFTASVLCGMVVLMSLITPMTTVTSDDVSRWNRFANLVARHGERFYGFSGLRRFKSKFAPEWRPRYLAAPGGVHLPAALLDVTRLISLDPSRK